MVEIFISQKESGFDGGTGVRKTKKKITVYKKCSNLKFAKMPCIA